MNSARPYRPARGGPRLGRLIAMALAMFTAVGVVGFLLAVLL